MYLQRMFKTFSTCGLLWQRSYGPCCKHANNFPIQIYHNYCSTSASNTKISTLNDADTTSEETVTTDSLVPMIKSNARLKHGPKYDYSFHDINNVVEYLLKYEDIKQRQLLTLFSKQPSLGQYYCKSWENTLDVLHGNGLPGSQILKMLESYPQLLKMNPAKIDETFICLRANQFYGKSLLKLIIQAPELLMADAGFISQKIQELLTLFTQKDILKLAINSPEVLLEDFRDTEKKVQYIVYEIGVEQTHIVSNSALSHSLQHIQLRHQIMFRTGMYRKPHSKKHIDNPNLSLMLDTPTKKFSEEICNISLWEYAVFERMLQRENEKRKKMEGASDSESDSESEDDS